MKKQCDSLSLSGASCRQLLVENRDNRGLHARVLDDSPCLEPKNDKGKEVLSAVGGVHKGQKGTGVWR